MFAVSGLVESSKKADGNEQDFIFNLYLFSLHEVLNYGINTM